jgi:hypothetical protein
MGGIVTALAVAATWMAPGTRSWLANEVFEVRGLEAAVTHATVAVAESPEPVMPASSEPVIEQTAPPTAATAAMDAPKRLPRKAAPLQPPPSAASTDSPRPADPCVPFYSVDERGIRRPKPECF